MGSIPAIGILLLKGILKNRLNAMFQYYIWLLLLLRLLIPFTIESPISLYHFDLSPKVYEGQQSLTESRTNSEFIRNNTDSANSSTTKASPVNEPVTKAPGSDSILTLNIHFIAYLWFTGVLLIYTYILFVNFIFYLKLRRCIPCKDEVILKTFHQCTDKLHLTRKVTLLYHNRIKSPMVWGILHPKILIPEETSKHLSEKELSFILLHELTHIKRRDLALNLIRLILLGIHWFNPVIWYSLHQMKQDCEISCDACVLKTLNEDEYKQYGLTILNIMRKMSELRLVPGTAGFAGKQNKRRIIMITKYKKTSTKWAIITLLCLTLLTGCASLSGTSKTTGSNNSKEPVSTNTDSNQGTKDTNASAPSDNTTDTETTPSDNNAGTEVTPSETPTDVSEAVSFTQYFDLLGKSKEDLIKNMGEDPSTIDEGGLEFKDNGIRVWLDTENKTVSQVFTQRSDIDFNGALIGDKIDSFKNAFGDPVSDKNGDMHFKYQNGYISVNYDTKTNNTFAVYLLSKDF